MLFFMTDSGNSTKCAKGFSVQTLNRVLPGTPYRPDDNRLPNHALSGRPLPSLCASVFLVNHRYVPCIIRKIVRQKLRDRPLFLRRLRGPLIDVRIFILPYRSLRTFFLYGSTVFDPEVQTEGISSQAPPAREGGVKGSRSVNSFSR
jgi:hypothetical protein